MASSLVMTRVWSIVMPGHAARRGPGGHDDVLRGELLIVAAADHDLALPRQPRGAFDPRDAVLFEEALDALGEARHDLVLAGVNGRHVERGRGAAKADAPVGGVLDDLQGVRVLEQRLGRDAPPQQARAAERLLALHDGGLEAQLRRADGRHVAAGAGANHDEVESLGHGNSVLLKDGMPQRFSEDSGMNVVAGSDAAAGSAARLGLFRVEPLHLGA